LTLWNYCNPSWFSFKSKVAPDLRKCDASGRFVFTVSANRSEAESKKRTKCDKASPPSAFIAPNVFIHGDNGAFEFLSIDLGQNEQ